MNIPLSEAESQLTDLVRRAEAGEEVWLTRDGRPVARVTATKPDDDLEKRYFDTALDVIVASARRNAVPGECAARSADFLYDEYGLPA